MKVVERSPLEVDVLGPVFITLKDADEHPVPAILEYLPYRREDGTADRDALTHRPEETALSGGRVVTCHHPLIE